MAGPSGIAAAAGPPPWKRRQKCLEQRTALADLAPGVAVQLRFIVLGKSKEEAAAPALPSAWGRPRGGLREEELAQLQVADETASIRLVMRGQEASELGFGEIFWLLDGEAFLDSAGRLFLGLGPAGQLQRDGFLTLAFEDRDISAAPWQPPVTKPAPKGKRKDAGGSGKVAAAGTATTLQLAASAAPRTPPPDCSVQASRAAEVGDGPPPGSPRFCKTPWHGAAVQKKAQGTKAAGATPGGGEGRAPSAAAGACLICGETGHTVPSCDKQNCAVAITCPKLVEMEGAGGKRHIALQEALQKANLPHAERARWYSKGDSHVLYALFSAPHEVAKVLAYENFCIRGQAAEIFAVQQRKRLAPGAEAGGKKAGGKKGGAGKKGGGARKKGQKPDGGKGGTAAPQVAAPKQSGSEPQEEGGSAEVAGLLASGCPLCGGLGHQLSECARRACGVIFECDAFEELAPEERQAALQQALRAASLPEAESLREDPQGDAGTLYAVFSDSDAVPRVLACSGLRVCGEPAKASPAQKGGVGHSAASKGPSSRGAGEGEERDCHICASSEHVAHFCPHWRMTLRITQGMEEDGNAIALALKGYGAEIVSLRWHAPTWYARLGSARQAKKVEKHNTIALDTRILGIFHYSGSCEVVTAAPSAPAEDKAWCFMCSSDQHRPNMCEDREKWVTVAGPRHVKKNEVGGAFGPFGATVQRVTWVGKRCYARLQSAKAASAVLDAACKGSGIDRVDGIGKLYVRPAVKGARKVGEPEAGQAPGGAAVRQEAPSAAASSASDEEELPSQPPAAVEEAGPVNERPLTNSVVTHLRRKICFLCGEANHELPSCPTRSQCVLVTRDWGAEAIGEGTQRHRALHAALCDALKSEGLTVVRSYWHRRVCYVQLANDTEARQLLAAKGNTGLLVGNETLMVRPARSTRSKARVHLDEAAPGTAADEEEALDEQGCLLCGADGHEPGRCGLRARSIVIRCSTLDAESNSGQVVVEQLARDAGVAAPERLSQRKHALYVVLASEEDVTRVLQLAVGEGFEVAGEVASVERVGGKAGGASSGGGGAQPGRASGKRNRIQGLLPRVGRPRPN